MTIKKRASCRVESGMTLVVMEGQFPKPLMGLRQGRPAAAHVCAEPSEADASRPAIEGSTNKNSIFHIFYTEY